jgi:predicted DNA-binding WGR domain protein
MAEPTGRRLVHLQRVNPERNEQRYYIVQVGPSLLDDYAVLRVWGRMGGQQRHTVIACQSQAEADRLADSLIRRRLRHGYVTVRCAPCID